MSEKKVCLGKIVGVHGIKGEVKVKSYTAVDKDIAAYGTRKMEDDLVVFSLDVNGLKEMNDTKGHAAGDKLLVDAAKCLASVFEPIGKVYRTGGDEFMAIAFFEEPISVLEKIRNQSEAWEGLSLSTGYASHREYPEKDIHGLEVLADQMMYREKKRYYNTPGHDRRKSL
jgi:diguanylate cyclase (GGDEF)-like protein